MIKTKHPAPSRNADYNATTIHWDEAPAFVVNPRGVLTHRMRCVSTHHSSGGKPSHHAADYWCGNGCCFALNQKDESLTDSPPFDRLLCHQCEAKATAAGFPSSDSLAGRHVHTGVLKAHQVCCLTPRAPEDELAWL